MESKHITLGGTDDAPTATITTATIGDMFTSLFSSNEAVTGFLGMGQKALLVGAGMVAQSVRMGGGVNIFKSAGA